MANEKVGFFVEKNEGRPSTSNELVKNFVHPYKENTNKKLRLYKARQYKTKDRDFYWGNEKCNTMWFAV